MPQTSPMNWMIITMMFFMVINVMNTIMKKTNKNLKMSNSMILTKSILWKW